MNIFNIFKRNVTPEQAQTFSKNYQPIQHNSYSQTKKINAVQTCLKILSENIARIPVQTSDKEHYLNFLLRFKPNNFQNANQFWSMIEYHRNYYGNAFAAINRDGKGKITDFQIIHPNDYVNYSFIKNELYFIFRINKQDNVLKYSDLLHFKCHSEQLIAESPLYSLYNSLNISKKASDTVDNFYSNNAQIPFYLEQQLPDLSSHRATKEHMKSMENEIAGVENAGRAFILPPNTKLVQMQLKFVDAQMIDTMKFTRDEICSAFGIPNYMLNDSDAVANVEQQSLLFRAFTIEPNIAIIRSELEAKLLTTNELKAGLRIRHDSDCLIDSDLKTKAEAYHKVFLCGAITPNALAEKFNLPQFETETANQPYLQQQQFGLFEKNNENE